MRIHKFKFLKKEKGQGLAEYGLILALVSIVAIATLSALGGSVNDQFNRISETLGGDISYPEISEDFVKSATVVPYNLSHINMVKEHVETLGLSTVNVPIRVVVDSADANTMELHAGDLGHAEALVAELKVMDVEVILEPFPWIAEGSIGETEWDPSDINAWFWNWKTVVLKPIIDEIANPHNVELLIVSNNLPNMEYASGYWEQTFTDVKDAYGYQGEIIYKTNWWVTADWDQPSKDAFYQKANNTLFKHPSLDVIGVAAYFELTDKADPSIGELKKALRGTKIHNRNQDVFKEIESLHKTSGKDIFFGEMGVPNRDGFAAEPWNPSPAGYGDKVNDQAQYKFYRAYIETFAKESWYRGFSLFAIGDDTSHYDITNSNVISYINGLGKTPE